MPTRVSCSNVVWGKEGRGRERSRVDGRNGGQSPNKGLEVGQHCGCPRPSVDGTTGWGGDHDCDQIHIHRKMKGATTHDL